MPAAVRTGALVLALGLGLGAGACARDAGEDVDTTEQRMTPLDRWLLGQATAYPADRALRERLPELTTSVAERRRAGWEVAARVLAPVTVAGVTLDIPRFQTWYAKDEVLPIFDRLLRQQTPNELAAQVPPPDPAITEAFGWVADRAPSLPTWSEERLAQRRAELAANGSSSLGGPERVLMSPAILRHLYRNYDSALRCLERFPAPNDPSPSPENFAPCVGEEFPRDGAIVKARWIPDTVPLEVYDTSAAGLATSLEDGEWKSTGRTATPDARSIYSMRLGSGITMRLAALHVITKELRDWVWVSLFWSDTPDSDFGADRPASFTGPFGHYKMCVVVGYDEGELATARASLDDAPRSLSDALAVTARFGPRTWCSNPYLEQGQHNARTNCIGCHQHAGTDHTTTSILEGPLAFPDGSRARLRRNFPADYTFITSTGLELGLALKSKVDQLAPPPR